MAVVAQEAKVNQIKTIDVNAMLSAQPPHVEDEPKELKIVERNEIIETATLKTTGEVDTYINNLRTKLYKFVQDGGVEIK